MIVTVLWSIAAFIIAIAILITVHEFGHFWVARRVGVKVLRFSIGFGKKLWSRQDKYGTEYVIAAVPLGGYVKMLDEREAPVAEAERCFAFNRKPLFSRIAVVVAGPLFNIFFAVFAYSLMNMVGVEVIKPIIGEVAPQSIAAKAGLQANQEIISVNQQATSSWMAVRLALIAQVGNDVQLPIQVQNFSMTQGANGQVSQYQLNLQGWKIQDRDPLILDSLGITPFFPTLPTIIEKITPQSPAAIAGLAVGDEIISINGQKISGWAQMLKVMRDLAGKEVNLSVLRGGKTIDFQVKLGSQIGEDGKPRAYLGIYSKPMAWPAELMRNERYSFFSAVWHGVKKTVHMTVLTCQLLGKMVIGDLSYKSISGPIGIAQGAGYSASLGLSYFLSFLAIVSISLAVINILPIPVLDGGHLLFLLIEGLTGKPVSERIQELFMRFGLIVLLGVMLFAIYNDIARL